MRERTKTTILGEFMAPAHEKRRIFLAAEGFGFTAVALVLTHSWALEQAGVFSIFFAAAGLSTRLNDLLAKNRDAIWIHERTSWDANRETAVSILVLFIGMTAAYVISVVLLGSGRAEEAFRFALDAAGIRNATILTQRFGSIASLFGHNGLVLMSITIIAFVYRTYGALLALAWNAAVWGIVLTLLVQRGLHSTDVPTWAFVSIAIVAVMPHLLLEALAYVVGALAAIFLSKGLSKYDISDPRLRQVALASAKLMGAALLIVAVAGAVESQVAPALLAFIRD